jgi:CDP-glucose 4,6-dehydratase
MEMTANLASFKGRRVFVTGDTGFKGSWLCWWLLKLGAEVAGYALAPRHDNDHFFLLHLEEEIQHTQGDIRDFAAFHKAVAGFNPEIVFHLAAQPLVRASYADPRTTIDTNVSGSSNLLDAIRLIPSVQALVFITSDKCYRNKEWIWGYRETDELGGHDPYSASKAAAEMVFACYWDSFFQQRAGFGAASVRAGNVIGGGDWSENRIVPDCIKWLQASQPITLRNPTATRPWQHVLEPLSGYLYLASRLLQEPKRFSGAWNFGPRSDSAHPVKDVADQIVRLWGSGEVRTAIDPKAPAEAGLLHLNCDKAHLELGWRPRWNFDRAVAETVAWYKEIFQGRPPRDITSRQIEHYCDTPL